MGKEKNYINEDTIIEIDSEGEVISVRSIKVKIKTMIAQMKSKESHTILRESLRDDLDHSIIFIRNVDIIKR